MKKVNSGKVGFRFKIIKISKSAAALIVVLGLIIMGSGIKGVLEASEAMAVPLENRVVLIDPGHGGIDAGASANGVVEKILNMQVAELLKGYIQQSGGVVYMTRTEDTNTADPNRKKGETQKMSDLKSRKKDIEKYKADIFVSIHMNKFSQNQYKGLQVFYAENSDESKLLGEEIQSAVLETLKDGNKRKPKDAKGGIYVLRESKVPSVLVECGFLSNADEANNLKDPKYLQDLAWGIHLGIIRYLSR